MKTKFKTIAALCAFGTIGFAMPAMGQEAKSMLPFELQVLKMEYTKMRADGLTRLYRQSIVSLRKAQAPFLRDGKLKESKAIANKIEELEKKIATLAAGKNAPTTGKPADAPAP